MISRLTEPQTMPSCAWMAVNSTQKMPIRQTVVRGTHPKISTNQRKSSNFTCLIVTDRRLIITSEEHLWTQEIRSRMLGTTWITKQKGNQSIIALEATPMLDRKIGFMNPVKSSNPKVRARPGITESMQIAIKRQQAFPRWRSSAWRARAGFFSTQWTKTILCLRKFSTSWTWTEKEKSDLMMFTSATWRPTRKTFFMRYLRMQTRTDNFKAWISRHFRGK